MDFIYELYQNDNFVLYLTIALVILIILFVVVLFLGKKDKKLEETRKLQKIDVDGFKEEKAEPVKVEIPIKEDIIEEDKKNIEPIIEEPKNDDGTLPIVEETKEDEDIHVTTFEPEKKTDIEEKIQENNGDELSLEKDLNDLEAIKKEFDSIELPKETEIKKEAKYKTGPQVFSSVFVNKENEQKNATVEETEVKVEEKSIQPSKVNLFSIEDEEEDMELPSLKEDLPKEEKKVNFSDIEGETYKVNK